MRKLVITGAGGYVGGRLVGLMGVAGVDVHAVTRRPVTGLEVPQTVCNLADAGSTELLADACAGAEAVIHLAGENEVFAARERAAALASTIVATERLVEACVAARVRRIVYVSTVHVYGARIADGVTLDEQMRPEPRSTYAVSRLASEHVAAGLTAGAVELVVLRLTNSVGAPDRPEVDRWMLVANDLCRQGSISGRLELRTSGTQWRDFIALADVCSALEAASRVTDPILAPGTYNLGSGQATTVRSLAGLIADEFERQTGDRPALHAPEPEPDPPAPYHVSVERAARRGLVPGTPLRDAVAETVEFCLRHREELA